MRSLVGSLAGSLRNQSPVPYVGKHYSNGLSGFGLRTDRGNRQAEMQAYGEVGTVFGIVRTTSQASAAVDWKLYRKKEDGRRTYGPQEMQRTEVTRHLALQVLNYPNPFFTRQELFETTQQHVDLVGEGWLLVSRDPRAPFPMELWPIRPDRIEPVAHPTDFLVGYVYFGPDGEQIPLLPDEVMRIRVPGPFDPYRGMGPIQSILTDVQGVRFSAEWNRNFFLNSAEPGGIIEVPEGLSDSEWRRLRERWNEQHRGVAAAHRVAILEHGKWVDRKYTMRDMQFAELRRVGRDAIREAFAMPKFALGDVEDVNRANAEASKAWFAEQHTVPRLERWKQMLNSTFLPMFGTAGQGVEFDYCDPIPPDKEAQNAERESKANTYKTLRDAGVDPDDAAMVAGLPVMKTVSQSSVTPVQDGGVQNG